MRPVPKLVPVPPTAGPPVRVDRSPFWIGSGGGASLQVHLPTIAERHASITEREDGFYLSPFPGASPPMVAGRGLSGPARLVDGQVIELGPTAKWEFVSGEPRIAPPKPTPEPEPEYVEEAPARRRPRRTRRRSRRAAFPLWAILAIVAIIGAVGFGGYYLYSAIRGGSASTAGPAPLTPEEGQLYDQLMVVSTGSIERGSMLLDLGLEDAALNEFTKAISTFESSPLAGNAWVRPSIEALVETVRRIYQENKGNIPAALRAAQGRAADLSSIMSVALSVDDFGRATEAVRVGFKTEYGRDITVTGADHAEHVSLYGRGGALDIRVRDLTRDQIDFLIANFKAVGIRVKDFSRDSVLQAQIAAARARGWNDRAGTGLHLHIDRFRDRRDKWTV